MPHSSSRSSTPAAQLSEDLEKFPASTSPSAPLLDSLQMTPPPAPPVKKKPSRKRRTLQDIADILARLTPADSVDTEIAAAFLGFSPDTLSNWRYLGRGPKYWPSDSKRGAVRYLVADLIAWRDRRRRNSTSDGGENKD